MPFKAIALVALVLSAAMVSSGQTRRTKRPRPKPATQATEPKTDPDRIHLVYSEDGRDYYLFQVAKAPDAEAVFYSYVVFFDQSTPAGRSALARNMALAKLKLLDLDQIYYVAAVQFHCFFNLKEPTKPLYAEVIWTDKEGNEITKLSLTREGSAVVEQQVSEIATYSEPYLQKLFDTLEESNEATRRLFKSQMDLLITLGKEDEARVLKFDPSVPKYVPALSLVVSGGAKHMTEVLKAANQAYDKTIRNAK